MQVVVIERRRQYGDTVTVLLDVSVQAQIVGHNSEVYCADRRLKSAEYAIARRRRA
jgi:hypothetical protein